MRFKYVFYIWEEYLCGLSGELHNGLRFKEDIENSDVLVVGVVAPLDGREDVDAGQSSSARLQTSIWSNVFKVRRNGNVLWCINLGSNSPIFYAHH